MFLHAVQEGPASQSYGLQVAALAGVPATVLQQARKHLALLERQQRAEEPQLGLFDQPAQEAEAPGADGDLPDPLRKRLEDVDPDRLTESASCIVLGDQEMALHLQRLLEQAGQAVPESRPVLELNPEHALIARLQSEADAERFEDLALVLYEQALLADGGSLEDPADFVRRVNKLLA